jgi:hypothetical protein
MEADESIPTQITSPDEATSLAEHLLDPSRLRPCAVVSTAAGRDTPYVDVETIHAQVRGLAEVYVLRTGAASWAFSERMPHGTQVYGGASRVYPVDPAWQAEVRRSPLHFAHGDKDGERATEAVISDAMAMALAAGLMDAPARHQSARAEAGTVEGVVGGRGFIRTASGAMVTIWPELVVPDVPAERLLQKGMQVTGLLDDADHRLDVRDMLVPVSDAVADYGAGSIVLARVESVDKQCCHLALVPGLVVVVQLRAVAGAGADDLRTLMTVGEVVLARISRVGQGGGAGWQLSMVDVDPGEGALPAPAILRGGPPWLQPSDLVPDEPEPEPIEPGPEAAVTGAVLVQDNEGVGSGTSLLEQMRAERDGLAQQFALLQRHLDKSDRLLAKLRTKLRKATESGDRVRRDLRRAQERLGDSVSDEALFADPEAQLEFEVYLMWARRTSRDEKMDLPLKRYALGRDFLSSWQRAEGIDRRKVIEVMVDVLTGRVHAANGRQSHQLRSGDGANDAFVSRPDGATCWRVSLQSKTPQARRLHYWALSDGSVEFSSVRLHDDVRP